MINQMKILETNLIKPETENNFVNYHLARSIAQLGVLNPIIVRYKDDSYELIDGLERLKAVRALGLGSIPCVVTFLNDEQIKEYLMLIGKNNGK